MKELNGLTGLRFLAALYVFLFHIHLAMPMKFLPAPVWTLIGLGALGVNLFFVLSGFILTYAHLKDYPAAEMPTADYYKSFMLKRVARIYPAYIIGLLIYWVVNSYVEPRQPTWPVVALDSTMLQSYFPALSMQWFGKSGWSVSTEFFFYLLFPFLLPLLLRIRTKCALMAWLVATVLVGSIPGLYTALQPHVLLAETVYSFAPSRLPEFVSGILLGLLILRHGFRVPEWVPIVMTAVSALYLAKWGSALKGYTAHNIVAIPTVIALITVVVRAESTHFFSWLGSGFMQYLGRISYSFYIMQLPVRAVQLGLLNRGIIKITDYYVIAPLFLLNVVLAIAMYEVVEKPAHRYLLKRYYRPVPALAL
ncbi:acyltransferase [Hymenobacter sp. 5317J-9]|uniref:acyltransferase family protein n=1 Tax=Hymenobacter sp. 5317J-9 TaxID=2932250 RepID=UPI001FD6B5BE|nr:acyltransferase [Hymenobacter sp. 5317J-9]UOQ97091.1 acyltransferase [Hymenobacter sp. 5317J-9]